MQFTIISDVHIKKPGDISSKLMINFLRAKETLSSDKIILLGDIFDLMIGNHEEYLDEYHEIFGEMAKRVKEGKEIIYFEGNHDFHISNLLKTFCYKNRIESNFKFIKTAYSLDLNGKNFIFCHGDDIEIGNYSYKLYKAFINNRFMSFIADEIFPYSLIKFIGDRASKASRERNINRYSHEEVSEDLKLNFRRASEKLKTKKNFDYLICGHSHIKDDYNSNNGFRYLNNGYAPNSKSFIFYDGDQFSFVNLSNELESFPV